MKDKDFYGGGEHPEAGSELVYINGKWHDTYDIYHPKCKSKYSDKNKTQNKIEKKTLSSVGFSRSRKIEDSESERSNSQEKLFAEGKGTEAFSKGEREQQLERLVILQNTEARLSKDLERTRSVIKSIKSDLSI